MRFLKSVLRTLFKLSVGPILALILIFEEWGWEPLQRTMARLERLPLWGRMEQLIRRLPPYAALLVFSVPALMLFPVKLLALYWIGNGHALLGLAVVLAAKMLGTAAVAWLFALTHPALMRLAWFANVYGRWKPWKDALMAQMKATAPWRAMHGFAHRLRRALRRLRDRMHR